MNLQTKLHLSCSCSAEVIVFTKDEDELYVSIYKQKMYTETWCGRLRAAWYAIRGILYDDNVVLDKSAQITLIEFLAEKNISELTSELNRVDQLLNISALDCAFSRESKIQTLINFMRHIDPNAKQFEKFVKSPEGKPLNINYEK